MHGKQRGRMSVSVIIPAWNLWSLTKECLLSLAANTPPGAIQVIVVDNGSTDPTKEALAPLGTDLFGANFRRVRSEENLGFARACNLGARNAGGELLFFLNNDTTATRGWLEPLLAAMAKPDTGAAGPLLLYPDGTLQHCGVYFSPLLKVGHLYDKFPGDHPILRKKRPLQAITGAAMLLPAQIFAAAGGFCEEYKNGYEDLDLCFAVRKLGHKLAVASESVIFHHVGQTPGRLDHNKPNADIFAGRWRQMIRPDWHIFARMDGYEPRLAPNLLPWLNLPAQKARQLAGEAESENPQTLARLLHAEPLWRQGWELLVEGLLAQGENEGAFKAGIRALNFSPNVKIMRQLAALAGAAGGAPIFRDQLAALQLDAAETARARQTVMLLRGNARRAKDAALTAVFDRWLLENGGNVRRVPEDVPEMGEE